jgi:transcriptional regulator with GAF, ATPase, and Fis domain
MGLANWQRGSIIKKGVFSAIQDVNETLALTNEPRQLVNMSLDTLSQVMEVECCWIQTIEGAHRPSLAAERGLTPEMREELAAMDAEHGFAVEVIGLGHRVVIPDLSADGAHGLVSFRQAGFKWLIAVPLMTYRVHGILGIASRKKKVLRKETPELAMVIGGLIGAALNKSHLSQKPGREKRQVKSEEPKSQPQPEAVTVPPKQDEAQQDKPFQAHRRRMKSFRGSHEPGIK